jgi:hypothetical protein
MMQNKTDSPRAAEVAQKGQDVGQMQNILLRKIEEMTPYIIQLEKRVNELEAINKK